jgi:hypothetical protein
MSNATSYLRFKSICAKITHAEQWFMAQRLIHWAQYEFAENPRLDKEKSRNLINHLGVPPAQWDEFWWRKLRIYRDSHVFAVIMRKYL